MQVRAKPHGLLTAGVNSPGGWLELDMADGSDVADLFEVLGERSPAFDPRACLALVGGQKVPLDWPLNDGDEVYLYHLFSGG